MDLLQAIVLGIVQGLTEFAPISSSAHLVLVPWLLGWPKQTLAFDTILHLGTLVAVVAVFWQDIWVIARDWLASLVPGKRGTPYSRMGWLLIVGTIPAAVLGYSFEDFFEQLFGQPIIVGAFLLVTALLLVVAEQLGRRDRQVEQLTGLNGVLIGIGQALAIAPGISRSGATMSTGLLLGLGRAEAARFSFLLSVPIIVGAAASQMKDLAKTAAQGPAGPGALSVAGVTIDMPIIVGFLAAAISGYLCINFLLGYLRRRSFYAFSIYCFIVGVTVIALGLLKIR